MRSCRFSIAMGKQPYANCSIGITGRWGTQQLFPGAPGISLPDHHWPLFGSSTYFPFGHRLARAGIGDNLMADEDSRAIDGLALLGLFGPCCSTRNLTSC